MGHNIDWLEKQLEKIISEKKNSQRTRKEVAKCNIHVLNDIAEGLTAQQIRKKNNWKNYELYRHLKPLKDQGFIKKISYALWEITQKGKEYLEQNKGKIFKGTEGVHRFVSSETTGINEIRVHAFRIKFPLLKDNSELNFWGNPDYFGYNVRSYNFLVKTSKDRITLQKIGKDNKTLEVKLHFFLNVAGHKDFEKKFYDALIERLNYVSFILDENAIEIERDKPSDINIEFAIKTPYTEELRKIDSLPFDELLDLKRLRKKIFKLGRDQKAIVKTDRSDPKALETNDPLHGNLLLKMPETIEHLSQSLIPTLAQLRDANLDLAENMKTHVSVLKKIDTGIGLLNKTLTDQHKVDRIAKSLTDPTIKIDSEMMKCPLCESKFSKNLYLERNKVCPNCHRQLDLYFPNIHKE